MVATEQVTEGRGSTVANERLARLFFEAQDRLRGGPDPELCAARYTAELGGNPATDRSGHEQFAQGFYAAFPDLRHEVLEVIANERGAAVRFVLTGTHTGAFFGMQATGRPIRVLANVLLHIENGRVARLQGVFDEAGMLRQLGAIPG